MKLFKLEAHIRLKVDLNQEKFEHLTIPCCIKLKVTKYSYQICLDNMDSSWAQKVPALVICSLVTCPKTVISTSINSGNGGMYM